jgi:hypothetical protein
MSQHVHHRRTDATTLTRDERCIECGSLLVPRNLAFGVIISAEADYVCVKYDARSGGYLERAITHADD